MNGHRPGDLDCRVGLCAGGRYPGRCKSPGRRCAGVVHAALVDGKLETACDQCGWPESDVASVSSARRIRRGVPR